MLSVKTTEDNLLTLQHYHESINELRLRLSTDISTDDLLPILVSTCILGTLEVHGFARPAFALAHYFACMQMLQKVPSERISNAEKTVRSFYRTVAETSLHGIANLSLFHPAPRKLFALIDWKFLSQVLESPYHQCRRPLELRSQFLAELPSFNVLQRLLFILIVICREPNPSESHHDQLRLIDQELDALQSQLPLFYGPDVREDIARAFGFRWRAVMYALRILVEKLSKPWVCSATPSVRHNLQLCIFNIVKLNTSLRSRPEIAWPPPFSNHGLGSNQNITVHWFYLVILAAAHTLEEINFAIPFLSKPKIWGDLTHFQKIRNFIDAVRISHRKPEKTTCDGISNMLHHHVHDGLDILISIDGPLLAKNATTATGSDIGDS